MKHILLFLISCAMLSLPSAGSEVTKERLVDRIVAVVDDQPIFHSDIERLITLELVEQRPEESSEDLRRRALDGLIDQRLRLREVERYNFGPVSTREIDRQMELIEQQFGGGSELDERLASVGLDREALRYLLTQQYKVFVYIEERLGPRILITIEDIQAYYDVELTEQMLALGQSMPSFEEVQNQIRALLREIRLNGEIAAWTAKLRQKAEILDFLNRRPTDLPPVVKRQTEEPTTKN